MAAAQVLMYAPDYSWIVQERCGELAFLIVGHDWIKIIEPVEEGLFLGDLKTELFPRDGRLWFRSALRGVDETAFRPLALDAVATWLPAVLDADRQVIALTAIHNHIRGHLFEDLDQALKFMATLDRAGVEALLP